jgi:hypothetical protein
VKTHIKPIRFSHTNVVHLFTDLILKVNQIVSWINKTNDYVYKGRENVCVDQEITLKTGLMQK